MAARRANFEGLEAVTAISLRQRGRDIVAMFDIHGRCGTDPAVVVIARVAKLRSIGFPCEAILSQQCSLPLQMSLTQQLRDFLRNQPRHGQKGRLRSTGRARSQPDSRDRARAVGQVDGQCDKPVPVRFMP